MRHISSIRITKLLIAVILLCGSALVSDSCSSGIDDEQAGVDSIETMQYFYYYEGKKIPLTLNKDKVIVSVPKDCNETRERILANVQPLDSIDDQSMDIFVISRSVFSKIESKDSWKEDSKNVILTQSYFTEGKKEVYSSPYLMVRLKREQDKALLSSYAEKYRLRMTSDGPLSPLMPLWHGLAVTPESEKSPLTCANELWESGDFAATAPDLVPSESMLCAMDGTSN
jgi:hypothetical protein